MLAPDRAADLAADLRALPRRERSEIMASFSPAERAEISALVGDQRSVPVPIAGPAPFSPFSPWLADQIAELKGGSTGLDEGWNMTPAARRLLLQVAQDEAFRQKEAAPEGVAPIPGRSLLGAIGGILSGKRVRA